jgi:Trypsin/Bacterial pre-peptidase C-terminal domain
MTMRRFVPLVCIVLLAASLVPALARRRPHRLEPRVVNGTFTSAFPTVGALLEGANAASASTECTGTMIGCQTFLTAAHCVCPGTGVDCQVGGPDEPNPSRLFVFLQHAGVFAVSSVALRSDYDFPVADVAVLTLAAPVTGIRPTPLNLTARPGTGVAGTIVGFGRQGNGIDDYGLKRTGLVSLAPCSGGVSNTTSVCWNYEDPVGPPGIDSNTCNGDSGGPLFVEGGCGPQIAGITSGGSSGECTPTDSSYDADVFHYRAFIQSAGGVDLNNTSCGLMPQVGEAGTTIASATGNLSSGTPDATHQFAVGAGSDELRVALNAIDDGGDYDLYVRFGSDPTTSVYDCRDVGSHVYGYCSIPAPAAGDWHVLVHRVSGTGAYQVTATTIAPGSAGPGTDGQSCSSGSACVVGGVCGGGQCGETPAPDGTPCVDGSSCTASDACTVGLCAGVATPMLGCAGAPARKSTASLKNNLLNSKDALRWNWSRGTATVGDFADPTASTSYEMCIFDRSGGVPALVYDQRVAAGSGWSASATGFRYRDTAGSAGGITSVKLRAGTGNAKVQVKGKGADLSMPSLPFDQDTAVTVQVTNGAQCWEATFSSNSKNQSDYFKASSD